MDQEYSSRKEVDWSIIKENEAALKYLYERSKRLSYEQFCIDWYRRNFK